MLKQFLQKKYNCQARVRSPKSKPKGLGLRLKTYGPPYMYRASREVCDKVWSANLVWSRTADWQPGGWTWRKLSMRINHKHFVYIISLPELAWKKYKQIGLWFILVDGFRNWAHHFKPTSNLTSDMCSVFTHTYMWFFSFLLYSINNLFVELGI